MDAADPGLSHNALAIAAAMALVAGNALFVGAELALVQARPGRLKALARQGNRAAHHALYLVTHLNQTLSVCQVGVTLCSLGLGWLGEPAFAHLLARALGPASPWLGPAALTIALAGSFFVITFLHIVLGELVPKGIAIGAGERLALALALPLRAVGFVTWPFVWLFNRASLLLLRPLGFGAHVEGPVHTAEEIRAILARSAVTGQIGPVQAAVVENLFRFARRRARDAMVPRARVVALDLARPADELMQRALAEGYSRYPLIRGSLDQLVGVVHVKDLLPRDGAAPPDLRRVARPPLVVPETLPLERLLWRFQHDHVHLAAVADEYGGLTGIVTLEDVLEELVGELRDEFDAGELDAVRPRTGGGWVLDPVVPVDRLGELTGAPIDIPDGVHTVAGLLQAKLGRLPQAGDRVDLGHGFALLASVVRGATLAEVLLVPTAGEPTR